MEMKITAGSRSVDEKQGKRTENEEVDE